MQVPGLDDKQVSNLENWFHFSGPIKGGDFLAILFSIPNDTLYWVRNGPKMPKDDL